MLTRPGVRVRLGYELMEIAPFFITPDLCEIEFNSN
jgi:hypothetical protein